MDKIAFELLKMAYLKTPSCLDSLPENEETEIFKRYPFVKAFSLKTFPVSLPVPSPAQDEVFYLIPIVVEKEILAFVYRAFSRSSYCFISPYKKPFFGLYDFDQRALNKPIILTEGIKDALVLKTIYPYTLSLLGLHLPRWNINFLKAITRRVILFLDSDSSGRRQAERLKKILSSLGFFVSDFCTPSPFKDISQFFYSFKNNFVSIFANTFPSLYKEIQEVLNGN